VPSRKIGIKEPWGTRDFRVRLICTVCRTNAIKRYVIIIPKLTRDNFRCTNQSLCSFQFIGSSSFFFRFVLESRVFLRQFFRLEQKSRGASEYGRWRGTAGIFIHAEHSRTDSAGRVVTTRNPELDASGLLRRTLSN